MDVITIAGAPSSGKTATVLYLAAQCQAEGRSVGAIKFDALGTQDHTIYAERLNIPTLVGLSDYICPDHYYVSNIEEACSWGVENEVDLLFVETAGLCYRCAPHIAGVPAVTVIDNLGGMEAPAKMGPALEYADIAVITKSDLVSQAEREVFAQAVASVNPSAGLAFVNGLTGTGTLLLKRKLEKLLKQGYATGPKKVRASVELSDMTLRSSLPASICSYCTGETRIGREYQSGNVEKICVPRRAACPEEIL